MFWLVRAMEYEMELNHICHGSARYAHTDLLNVTAELLQFPVNFIGRWRHSLTYD